MNFEIKQIRQQSKWKDSLLQILLYGASVFIFILPAIAYRYPLLYPDSGTYLTSGHTGYVPVDRPIIYGLFVRFISLSKSVWLVILCQSVIWNYLIHLAVRFTIGLKKKAVWMHFFLALFLGLFTGIGYYCSLVIADIFTSISILSLYFLFSMPKQFKLHLFLLSIIFAFSIITHLSHIPLVLSLWMLIVLYYWMKGWRVLKFKLKRLLALMALILSSLFCIALVNQTFGVGFTLSRTNHIFFATRFIESGLANQHLKKNCGKEGFEPSYADLCNYIDKFEQWPAAGFYLYDYEKSPLYNGDCMAEGWPACWVQKNDEYGELIQDILLDRELRFEFVQLVFDGTLKQLTFFEQSSLSPQDMAPFIEKYYPNDLEDFRSSLQRRVSLLFDQSNAIEYASLWVCLVLLVIFLWMKWTWLSENEKLLIYMVLTSLLLNAVITSTLSNVVARYQGRIIFFIPFLTACLLLRYLIQNYQLVERNDKE